MDVVYVVRPGDDNEQLRHSLRSLVNLPHDCIWVVGCKPWWVSGVGHIRIVQGRKKHANTTNSVRAACENPDVSDPFIYFNDDFYVMHEVDEVATWHRGQVFDLLGNPRVTGPFRRGGEQTLTLLGGLGHPNPYSYELHVPMVVDKAMMLKALDIGRDLPVLHKRTMYGNLAGIGGTYHEDVKIHGNDLPHDSWPFWSTGHRSFLDGRIGQLIRERFNEPSPYETTDQLTISTEEEGDGPMALTYLNTRTGRIANMPEASETGGSKRAQRIARQTLAKMDASRKWRRISDPAEIEAAQKAYAVRQEERRRTQAKPPTPVMVVNQPQSTAEIKPRKRAPAKKAAATPEAAEPVKTEDEAAPGESDEG